MLTLHRLPPFLRILYVGVAAFWVLAVGSHWLRLSLRHGVSPGSVREWYLGNEADDSAEIMMFERPWAEVAEDSWHNLLHHTLALLVMTALVVRASLGRRSRALLAGAIALSIPATVLGPILIRTGIPGAATGYIFALALLQTVAITAAVAVFRDCIVRGGSTHRGAPGMAVLIASVVLVSTAVPPAAAQDSQRLMTEAEGLAEAFPAALRLERDIVTVDATLRTELESELGRPVFEMQFEVVRAYAAADSLLGYAVVTDEQGKYRPITMLVALGADRSVRDVSILVYRESRGGEVARDRFLRQYRGRDRGDPIRINRDIVNVAGATISVISVNQGVRKILALIERVYR